MSIIIALLIALLAAIVLGAVFHLFAPQFEKAAALVAFILVLLVKLGGL